MTLKEIREKGGLSQAKLAEASGVPQQTISAVESGTRSPGAEVLYKLARALGVTMDELYGGEKHDHPNDDE